MTDKRLVERFNVVKEVLKTEKIYVRILLELQAEFSEPLKLKAIIPEDTRKRIFPSVLFVLMGMHKTFLGSLARRITNWNERSCIGDLFLDLCPMLNTYTAYVIEFSNVVKAYNDAKQSHAETLRPFLAQRFVEIGDPGNDLSNLLITPVQRMPRYLLFVKTLLKNTPEDHPDYKLIKEASEKLSDACLRVETKAEESEQVWQIYNIQERLKGEFETLVSPHRRFVAEEMCSKVGKTERDMKIYIFSDIVLFAKVKRGEEFFFGRHNLIEMAVEDVEKSSSSKLFTFKLYLDRSKPENPFVLLGFDSQERKSAMIRTLTLRILDVWKKESTLRRTEKGDAPPSPARSPRDELTSSKSEVSPRIDAKDSKDDKKEKDRSKTEKADTMTSKVANSFLKTKPEKFLSPKPSHKTPTSSLPLPPGSPRGRSKSTEIVPSEKLSVPKRRESGVVAAAVKKFSQSEDFDGPLLTKGTLKTRDKLSASMDDNGKEEFISKDHFKTDKKNSAPTVKLDKTEGSRKGSVIVKSANKEKKKKKKFNSADAEENVLGPSKFGKEKKKDSTSADAEENVVSPAKSGSGKERRRLSASSDQDIKSNKISGKK